MSTRTIQTLSPPLIAYAVCGLILSVVVHLLALVALQPNSDGLLFGLVFGIFPLWLPVTYISMKLSHGASRKDYWKLLHAGCPAWMGHIDRILYWYALASFVLAVYAFTLNPSWGQNAGPARIFWILASSYCMLFYFVGLCAVITAYRKGIERRCPNSHVVGVSDKFCPTCGIPVTAESIGASPS